MWNFIIKLKQSNRVQDDHTQSYFCLEKVSEKNCIVAKHSLVQPSSICSMSDVINTMYFGKKVKSTLHKLVQIEFDKTKSDEK